MTSSVHSKAPPLFVEKTDDIWTHSQKGEVGLSLPHLVLTNSACEEGFGWKSFYYQSGLKHQHEISLFPERWRWQNCAPLGCSKWQSKCSWLSHRSGSWSQHCWWWGWWLLLFFPFIFKAGLLWFLPAVLVILIAWSCSCLKLMWVPLLILAGKTNQKYCLPLGQPYITRAVRSKLTSSNYCWITAPRSILKMTKIPIHCTEQFLEVMRR